MIDFRGLAFDSYYASVLSDFLRRKLLDAGRSMCFETVMSHSDKVDLLREAQTRGYRTYLYFIATVDPLINVERVKYRVSTGGHDVPEEKIRSRYDRSLELLPKAIRYSNRAYLFDTSSDQARYFAEITDGKRLELLVDRPPTWFEPVWREFYPK